MSIEQNISKKYNPKEVEEKWYEYWLQNEYFRSEPNSEKKPYTIVIPPPNVTGVLHMGHMLNNTLQDVIIRRARMQGYNACWVPGTDHASIATEAKVVNKLKEQGVSKYDIGRDKFLEEAWNWTHKHGGIILEQLKKLGCSCDWQRTKFTLDKDMSDSVIKMFVKLYEQGLIYRGNKMINWDPEAKTNISDEEVNYIEKQGKLYFLKYKVVDSDEYIVVATTRPETIFGDTAVCFNPNDERYLHLKGKKLIVPIVNREVPAIFDEYVDLEFGTGSLKVTPCHDINDYELGKKHQLESIDIFDDNASLNEYGLHYKGKDRFEVRKLIEKELKEKDLLEKVENYTNKVGTSERTGAVIEPKISVQWFLKMKDLAKPALDVVMNEELKFYPQNYKNTYRHWMENIYDWNISRQLWWGHQIPAYYYGNGQNDFVVATSKDEAISKLEELGIAISSDELKQDNDVLDTWFSSWLWPISVFDGVNNPDNEEINYYYPTQDLVTGPDIIFFWVARMIMAGYSLRDEMPFKNVYFTGIVRDKQGRKMSKQLGNSPDPIELMKEYGADGVRVGMLMSSSAGNDLKFDIDLCLQGRNFANKIWNAFRLIKGWKIEEKEIDTIHTNAIDWFTNRFNEVLVEIDDHFSKYRISDALLSLYKLIWEDFCSWYLEIVKPNFGESISKEAYDKTIQILENLLKTLHPFMPFITEDLWQSIQKREKNEAIIISEYPLSTEYSKEKIKEFDFTKEFVSSVRNYRQTKGISPKENLQIYVQNDSSEISNQLIISKIANCELIFGEKPQVESFSVLVGKIELLIPVSENIDVEKEKQKAKEEIDYLKGFLKSVDKKLSNEKFVQNAKPEVVANERKKKEDAEEKIRILESQL
ncbi:MAG: valine--tRNA ligase [Flavobacteriales bacterium]|nr:valine--tRNA ligase [Flavobacteriales bacterium]